MLVALRSKLSSSTRKGITLIEMLVLLGLMITLSTILLPQYLSIQKEFSLLRAAYKLSQDIRRAREMSISAQSLAGTVPPGYGIYLVEGGNSYLLYADTSGNQAYNQGVDQIVETINLPNRIYFSDISGPSPSAGINFRGPDPIVTITGSLASIDITLGFTGITKTNIVTVNKAGLVYATR